MFLKFKLYDRSIIPNEAGNINVARTCSDSHMITYPSSHKLQMKKLNNRSPAAATYNYNRNTDGFAFGLGDV